MFLAKKLNRGAGTPVALDAQFNYVTMLLHGDGTNGAQNNTFLDSSTNNFTITRNGNTTQGSFSPYGSNWSNYFNGTSGYLTAADNAALNFGTGDFTIEGWFYLASYNGASLIAKGVGGTSGYGLGIGSAGDKYSLYLTSLGEVIVSSSTAALNTFTHVAATRSGSTVRLFVNGVVVGTYTSSADLSSTEVQKIGLSRDGGSFFNGYISNVRIVKGTALYTSNFTPSTTPLTAVSGTSLLTCQSNRFVDNSTNNFTITVNGDTSVQRFNPFGTSTAYSTSVIGGSGYFDGSGDYLNTPSTSQFTAAGDFTVSCWFYLQSFANSYYVVGGNWDAGASDEWLIQIANDGSIRFLTTASTSFSATGLVKLNQWTYFTATRSGTTVTVQLNGTTASTYTKSDTLGAASKPINIGQQVGGSWPFNGYISDFRLLSGSAITTVPTAPVSSTSTGLLLSMTNGAIFDNAMMNDLETLGNSQISTSVKKYGTGSMAFDGTGDYLKIPYSPNLQFGTGAYTLEFWLNTSSVSQWLVFNAENNSGIRLYVQSNGTLELDEQVANADNNIYSTATVNDGAWHHIALSRAGGAGTKMFVDGIYQSQQASAYNFNDSVPYYIGTRSNLSGFLTGYIDDLRITKGFARYTANFTPPTAAFPNTGPI